MITNILDFIKENISRGNKVALVTVTKINGSSPASVGQCIAVLENGESFGTVGGGKTEYLIIQEAIKTIKDGNKIFEFNYDHSEKGMICGGAMSGFGHVLGDENYLYIFGAGHIGMNLAKIATDAGFFVKVIEDRPEFADNFKNVEYIVTTPEKFETDVKFYGNPYIVICTRGHGTDDAALRFCLNKDYSYLGMIGSKKKVATLFGELRKEGYDEKVLQNIYTPIGLNIASGVPYEIAISILAEILLIKNGGSVNHKKMSPTCSET